MMTLEDIMVFSINRVDSPQFPNNIKNDEDGVHGQSGTHPMGKTWLLANWLLDN